jgi:hypothetical protein
VDKTRKIPADNFRQMGELGLMGMMISKIKEQPFE